MDMEKTIRCADLLAYVSKSDVGAINHLFRQDGYVVATDGHILLRVKESAVADGETVQAQDAPNVARVMPKEMMAKPRRLSVAKIEQALEQAPKVKAREECHDCGGSGFVTWRFEGEEDEYEKEDRCPCCHGRGYKETSGEPIPDPKQVYSILNHEYETIHLQRIISVMRNVTKTDYLTIVSSNTYVLMMQSGAMELLIAGGELDAHGNIIKVI